MRHPNAPARPPEDMALLRGTSLHETTEQRNSWRSWIETEMAYVAEARRNGLLP